MKYLLITFCFIVLFCGVSKAQKGTAEPDFYPQGYVGGMTWSGVVTAVNEDKNEITLTYSKKDNEETFTGVLVKGYWGPKDKKGNLMQIKVSDLMGYRIKVYYSSKTVKDAAGSKNKINNIYIIKILPKDE